MIKLDHPFFRTATRRYIVLAVCFGWGVFELSMGAVFWAVVFIGIGAVAAWRFSQIDWSKYENEHGG